MIWKSGAGARKHTGHEPGSGNVVHEAAVEPSAQALHHKAIFKLQ